MKKIITLALVVLLMFALTLTGCGGGTDEPEVVPDSAVEDDADLTQEDLVSQYNIFAALFTELDAEFTENGIYDTNEELKANMDHAYELTGMYAEIIGSVELTDEEITELYAEIQANIDSLNRAKEGQL